jgi:lycopene cyclase domain-containing protein
MMLSTYGWINLATIVFPILLSFDKKVGFYKLWRYTFPAIAISSIIFIIKDIVFTQWHVWGFNPAYVSSVWIKGLPLEEWFFFITVPYACLFIYACLNAYFPTFDWKNAPKLSILAGLGMLVIGLTHLDRTYTSTYFCSAGAASMLMGLLSRKNSQWSSRFWRAFGVSIVPFLFVNGILTYLPVVIYNSNEILNLRIISIPIEDVCYCFCLLLINTSLFEFFKTLHLHEKK